MVSLKEELVGLVVSLIKKDDDDGDVCFKVDAVLLTAIAAP